MTDPRILDLKTLLSGLPESREDIYAQREERKNRYSLEDAKMMLKNAYELLETEHDFEGGDFIRPKRGLENGKNSPCGGVAIFIRYISESPYPLEPRPCGAPVGTYDDDCIIGVLLPEGAMVEYMACSRYYEPCPY